MSRWLPRIGLALVAWAAAAPADAGAANPAAATNLVVRKVSVFGNNTFKFTGSNGIGNFEIKTAFGEGVKEFALPPGIYQISETVPDGWQQVSNGCHHIVIAPGSQKITCEIVNMMMMGMQGVRVHIKKYLDGKPATTDSAKGYAFPMTATWKEPTGPQTTQPYTLAPDSYIVDTQPLAQGSFFTTSEVTNDLDPTSKVFPRDCDCPPGKYQLVGYSVSSVSFADAAASPVSPSPLPFHNLTGDVWVVVHNKSCLSPGWLKVIKLTTSGDGTFNFTSDKAAIGPFSITTTGGFGFKVLEVPAGTYDIVEQYTPGWTTVNSTCEDVVVEPGKTAVCTVTNKKAVYYGEIRGRKCQVTTKGGLQDCIPLEGWKIYLDRNNNGSFDPGEPSDLTNAKGRYRFQNLVPGNYVVREVPKAGWVQVYPASGAYHVTVQPGQIVKNKNFGNLKCDYGRIGGVKFEDKNCNGWRDPGEGGLANWTIVLKRVGTNTQLTTTTNAKGEYVFDNLAPGTYLVTEVQKNGWIQTTPNPAPIVVTWGTDLDDVNFGNRRLW
ncbi:MAG: collagen binding domain-containing protein [Vicinamibacterales bacterium]